jgi:predicted outer membrane repeat protein
MYSHKRQRRVSTWRANLECLEPRRLLATYTVDTLVDENDANHGPGDFSLREAIAAAAANAGADTVNFDSSLAGNVLYLSDGPLLIQSSLTLNGGTNHLTISADEVSGVLAVSGGVVVSISNLEVIDGQANTGAGLKITKTTSVTPQVTLTRVSFVSNQAVVDGGAIYSDGAKLTIIECNISQNSAGDDAGGVFAIRGTLEVRNSMIFDNSCVASGGGIVCSGPVGRNDSSNPAMHFSNSTIAANWSGDQGGGVAVLGNAARFVNCTIVANRADTKGTSLHDGGGIRTDTSDSSTTLYNTIVAGNRRGGTTLGVANDLDGNVSSGSAFNLVGHPGSAGGLTNGVNRNQVGKNGGTRPLSEVIGIFHNHGGPTLSYTLANNSPALDAGSNARAVTLSGQALTTDQRGVKFARIVDGPDSNSVAIVDIGAIEMRLPRFSLGAGASYTENAAPVLIAPGANMFGDFASFAEATLTVSLTANGKPGDRVTILHEGTGPGQVKVEGAQITYNNSVIGTFSPSTGIPPLEIDFANVKLDAVEAVLRRLAFSTSGNNPSPDTRTVYVQFSPFQGQQETSDLTTVAVVPQNDAPILDNSLSPTLAAIEEDATDPASTLVADLLAGAVTDPDVGAQQGMAVTAASNFHGNWQFTLDGGTTWQAMGEPSSSRARLLPSDANTRVRFLPNANFNGTVQLYYRAWDRTHGTAGGTLPIAGNSGGTGSLSRDTEHAPLTVTPVNDAPLLALSGTVNYDLDAAAVTLAPNAVVTDIDSFNFGDGRLRVRITDGASSANHLAIGAGFSVDANHNVLQGTTIIGRLAANGKGTNELIVTFNSAATRGVVQQLVRAITFKTGGGSAGLRKVVFTVSDGDGGLSDEAIKMVNVT